MNVVLSSIKAHLFNSCTSAVDLVQNNPSPYNIHLARCLLHAKRTALDLSLTGAHGRAEINEAKINKYNNLLIKLTHLAGHSQINNPSDFPEITQNDLPARSNHDNTLSEGEIDEFAKTFYLKIANLSGIDFTNRDLRQLDFTDANELPSSHGMPCSENFAGADLTAVDLSGAFLEGSNFKGATLNHAKLLINSANFTDAALDNVEIKLAIPEVWDDWSLDCLLNSDNNHDTVLSTINTIDDKYPGLKINLIHQILDSFENKVDIEDSIFPKSVMINMLFSKQFYIQDKKISLFCDKLLEKEIIKANEKLLLKSFNNGTLLFLLDTISHSAESNKQNFYMMDNNGFFNQLMVLCVHHDSVEIREKSRDIYSNYVKLDQIKTYAEKFEYGNGNKQPDWSDKNIFNYILINKDKAIIIDHMNFAGMLHFSKERNKIKWDCFFFYCADQCQSKKTINYSELFNEQFKIFSHSYQYDLNKSSFEKLIDTLNLCEYESRFKSVIAGKPVSQENKLIEIKDQLRLQEIFQDIIAPENDNPKETILKTAHIEALLNVFQLESASDKVKAQTFVSLAALFAKYSSSAIFGTEEQSPQVLRDYSYALMNKANELDSEVLGNKFGLWKNHLLGLNDAFTCTAVLSTEMIYHAHENFDDVISALSPPIWG